MKTQTPTSDSPDAARLRIVLRANAATSIIGGLIALVAGSWVSRELGVDHIVLTRLLGAGLVIFALQVLIISRANERRLLTESLLVSVADAGWVAGSVVVMFSGVLSSTGNVVIGLIALAVADFGATQVWLRSKAQAAPTRRQRVAV